MTTIHECCFPEYFSIARQPLRGATDIQPIQSDAKGRRALVPIYKEGILAWSFSYTTSQNRNKQE